jgi:uracil permease
MPRALKTWILAVQHVFAMFGATVLVPILTGLNPSVALLGAGIGTLIFHLVTKGKVPVFLGSSFAFIAGVQVVGQTYGLPYATGGIVVAGALYLLFALLVKQVGVEKVKTFFPPVVTGSMIIVIGLTLAPALIGSNILGATMGTLGQRWLIAAIVVAAVVVTSIFAKGMLKSIPILVGIIVGYIASFGFNLVNTTAITGASWLTMPELMFPKFNLAAIAIIAPIVIVTFMEHIGDIATNGAVVGKDFLKEPGLHRTLIGDGLATMFAGLIGAPANTTYSENTGVLAVTKNYNPVILRFAAVIAIVMAFIGKLGGFLQSIPLPVMGGISIILFGMIASVGIRTLVDNRVDFSKNKNMIIVALMLVLGLSGVALPLYNGIGFTGMSLAAVLGIVLNKVLPE